MYRLEYKSYKRTWFFWLCSSLPETHLTQSLLSRQIPASGVCTQRSERVLLLRRVGQAEAVEEDQQREAATAPPLPRASGGVVVVVGPRLEHFHVGDHADFHPELLRALLRSRRFEQPGGAAPEARAGGEDEKRREEESCGGGGGGGGRGGEGEDIVGVDDEEPRGGARTSQRRGEDRHIVLPLCGV